MPYRKPILIDKYASKIEDYLTERSFIPLLGTVPAVFKIAFGAIQTLCAASTLVASTFFLMTQTGHDIWCNSFRHIMHGISNILAGIIQAIPLIGSLAIGYQSLNNARFSDADKHYSNNQSHKFFAYKSLEDTSWVLADCTGDDPTPVSSPDEIPAGAWVHRAPYSC